MLSAALVASLAATWWLSRSQTPLPAAVAQGMVLLAALLLAATLPYLALVIERTAEQGAPVRRISHLFAAGLALGMARPPVAGPGRDLAGGRCCCSPAAGRGAPVIGVGVPFAASAWCLERPAARCGRPLIPVRPRSATTSHISERTS